MIIIEPKNEKYLQDFYNAFIALKKFNRLDWDMLLETVKFSEDFLIDNADLFSKAHWSTISQFQSLTETFIETYLNELNIYSIQKYQKLSEDFIRRREDIINFRLISETQILSEPFIEDYLHKLDLNLVLIKQSVSSEFILKYQDNIVVPDLITTLEKINPNAARIITILNEKK